MHTNLQEFQLSIVVTDMWNMEKTKNKMNITGGDGGDARGGDGGKNRRLGVLC